MGMDGFSFVVPFAGILSNGYAFRRDGVSALRNDSCCHQFIHIETGAKSFVSLELLS